MLSSGAERELSAAAALSRFRTQPRRTFALSSAVYSRSKISLIGNAVVLPRVHGRRSKPVPLSFLPTFSIHFSGVYDKNALPSLR